jgi:hypothetical protein
MVSKVIPPALDGSFVALFFVGNFFGPASSHQ